VPSDVLLLDDIQSIQMQKYVLHWQNATLTVVQLLDICDLDIAFTVTPLCYRIFKVTLLAKMFCR
jgi:hypothetical protein